MTAYLELPALVRSLFTTCTILLMIAFIIITAQALIQRRYAQAGRTFLWFCWPYVMFHVCADVSNYYLGGELHPVAERFAQLPYGIYLFVFFALGLFAASRFRDGYIYNRNHITPSAIKEAADGLDTGFCYYYANGYPFLTNYKMNELVSAITGHPLQNAADFAKLVSEKNMHEVQGTVYHFSTRTVDNGNEQYGEIIADDVTEFYQKSRKLQEGNQRLREQNGRMKEYGERIGEIVREEEILKTKMNIHDEMNRILLQTDYAIHVGSQEDRARVLDTWQKNIFLFCMEADEDSSENPLSDLEELGRMIGMKLHFPDGTPDIKDVKALRLFVLTAEEAMVNASKHAGAGNFYIALETTTSGLCATFTNDGKPPAQVTERGGLVTIRRRIEEAGGTMTVTKQPEFALTIIIPVGGKQYV